MKKKKNKKKIDIGKIVSHIIFHKFYSHHLTFKIANINNELSKKYKINASANIIHAYLFQLLKKGLIKYQDPYQEPTKNKCKRLYKITIDSDIILWFMKNVEYGQKIYEMNNNKSNVPTKHSPPKISI